MADLNSLEILLAAVSSFGPLMLGVLLFLSPLGLPFPSALLVLATGALVQQDMMNWQLALFVTIVAPILGDCTSYALGRSVGGWVRNSQRRWAKAWHRADVPTNLLAGSSGLAFYRFLGCAAAGRATWIALYGGLGHVSGSLWEAAGQTAGAYAGWLSGLVVVGLGAYTLLRRRLMTGASCHGKLRTRRRA